MRRLFSIGMVVLTPILMMACSSSSTDSADAAVDASPTSLGETLVKNNVCASCHGENLAGNTTGIPNYKGVSAPNITPDSDTGIGGWSDDQIKGAIRTGVDDEGASLCSVMPRFGFFSDTDVSNVVAYLRSLPAVKQDVDDTDCPTASDAGASKDAAAE